MSTTTPPGDTSQEKQLEVIPPAAAAAAEAMTTVEGEGGEETGTAAEGAKARSEGGKKKKKAMLMPKSAEAEDAAEAERKKLKGNKRRSSKKKGSNESSEGDANDPSAEASLGEEEEVVVEEDGNISSGSTPSSTSSTSSNKKKKKSSSKKSKSKKKSAEGDNSSDSDDSDEGEKENEKDKDKDKKEKEKDYKKDKEKKKPKKLSLFPKKKKDGKGDDADDDAGEHIADPDDTADKDKEKEKEKEKEKDKKKKPKKSSDTASGSSTSAASSSSSSHRRKKRDSKTPSTATTPSVPDDTLSASSSSMTATFVDDSATAPSPTEEPSPSPSMTPSEGFTIHVPPPPSSLSAAAAATATSSLPPSSSTVPTEAGLAASPAAIIIPPAPIVPGSPASIVIPPAPVPPAATVAGLPASPASIVIPPAPMPTGSPASIIIPPPPAAMTSSIGSPRTSVTAGVTAATATTASPSAAGLMSPGSAAAAASLKSPRNNVAPIQMQGSAQPQQQFGMRASPATPTMSAPWGLQPPAFGTEGGPHGARARAASSAPGCGYVILSNGLVVGNPTAAAAAAVAGGSPHGRTIDADLAGADKYEYEYEYEAPGSTSPSALAKNLARPNMKMPPPRLSALSASAGVGVGTAGVKPAMMATGTSPIVIKAQARGVPLHQQQLQQFERFKRQPGQGYQVQAQQQQQQQQQQHVVSSKYQDLMLPEGWEAAAAAKALDECSRFVLREAYESELLFVKAVDSLVDDFYTPLLQNVEKMRGKSKDSDKGTAKDAEKDKDKDKEKDKDKDKDAEKEKEKEKESTKEKDLEKSLENLFRGVGALRAVSRDVIRRLIDVAEAGEPYYLASLYAGAGEYVEAYGEFLRTHREGLIILQTLEERNSHFNRGLAACRSVCFPALGLVDIFWLVATRMTHVYKIAQDQAAYRRATDALGARLVAYEQFCTTRCGAPVLGPSARTCFPVAATTTASSSSSSSTAAAATAAAAAAAEEDLARLNTIHVRSTFLSEIYDGIGALRLIIPTPDESVPPTLHRKLLGSAEVFIRDKVPFGLSTDTPARAMFFNDGVALCRALPLPRQLQPHEGVQSVVQRKQHYQLVHWYPAAALTANKTGCEREVRIARWRNKQETKGKMPPGWEEETGKGGKHVYVNRVLGITQTHRPECAGAALSEAAVKLAAADPEAYEACVRLLRAVTGGAEIGEELGAGTAYAMVGTRLEPLLAYEQELYPGITVPTLPHTLCHHIIACGMGEQGIFRLAAEKRAIDDVCHQVNTGHLRDIKLGTLSIHIVTALLKTFLRELPDPLIPGALYNAFLACGEIEDPAVERAELARLIRELPPPNRDLLCELVAFGSQIAANTHVNSMDAGNLGIVIAPNILYKKGAKENITSMNISNNVIAFMIEHCTELFPGPSSFAAPSAAAVASAAATGGGCGSAIAGGASYKWASFKRKLLGHEKSIRVMGLSASGRTVVSIDGSGKAFVWDTASCAYVRSIELGIKYPMAIALVGQNFWVASQDAIHVYNSEDLSPVAQIQHPCFSLVYLETRGEVWAGSKGKVLILSVFNFSLLASFDDPDQTIYFAMAPAGPATIWCAGSAKSHDQSIHVWDCVSRREIAVFPAHTKRINALAADPAHNTVWSAAEDHTIGVWDASSFRLIHRIARHNSAVNALCVLSDQVWSSSWDRSLMIWDPASARYLGEIKGYHSDYVSRILPVTTPSGSTDVWTQSVDICVWSVAPAPPIIEDTFTL